MIIYIDISSIKLKYISHFAAQMPINRQIEYQQMITDTDKINCILAFLIVKYHYLESGYGKINFLYTYNGKPYIENNPIYFSISHSKNIVAVGFSDNHEIGIDVEKVGNVDSDIINILYSNKEKEQYKDLLDNNAIFYKAWSMKESYAKMLGLGLHFEFSSLSLDLVKDLNKIDDYYIHSHIIDDYCFAITTKSTDININKIKTEEIIGRFI